MTKVVRKTPSRGKPKSAKNASAKKVKRATRSTTTAAKRATQTATSNTKQQWKAADDSASAVLKMGTEAIQQMLNNPATAGAQNQIMSMMGKEGAAQLQKSADAASRSMGEIFSISRDNVEACVTCGSIAVNASKQMSAELVSYANKSFSQNVEMSKEVFSCRTLNDMFDLQSRVMKANMDSFFSGSVKMSELMFQCATEVSEPLNERVSDAAQRISKTISEAA